MNIYILLKYLYIKYVIITNENSIFEKNMMVLNLNTISLLKWYLCQNEVKPESIL